jgi:hypothetical protein
LLELRVVIANLVHRYALSLAVPNDDVETNAE